MLRKTGVNIEKVRGIQEDQNDAIIRLSDSLADFVRDGLDGKEGEFKDLYERAVRNRRIIAG